MAVALAAVKVVVVAAAFLLAGIAGVHPAEAVPSLATTSTLSVDRHLVNICEEVTFTLTYTTTLLNHQFTLYLDNILNDGTGGGSANFTHTSSSSQLGTTTTKAISFCTPGRYTYRVRVSSRYSGTTGHYYVRAYSNTVVVHSLNPAEGGKESLKVVPDGGTYTNTAPIIGNLDYDAPEAITSGGATSFNASVLVKWSAVARATGYEIVANSPSEEVIRETTDTEAAATQALVAFTDIYPNNEQSVPTTFQVRAFLDTGEASPVFLDTGSGGVAVSAGAKVYSPLSETATINVGRAGNNAPIDTTTTGDPSAVAPGEAIEGINEVARFIAKHTGMGAGAATAFLPLLCLVLAGGATAMVVLPLGFSPLSLFAGFLVFILVWSVGGVAWFGLPIAMAVLPPVLLAVCGAMLVKRRGLFG